MTYEVDLVFDGDYHKEAMQSLNWAKKNCPSYIKNAGVSYPTGALITFTFNEEKDAMWFGLKWGELVYET